MIVAVTAKTPLSPERLGHVYLAPMYSCMQSLDYRTNPQEITAVSSTGGATLVNTGLV